MKAFNSPFLEWSVDDIYTFFCKSIQPAGDEISGRWPAHTFVVLDERTVKDRTCLLCSDVPDYLEDDRVVLKQVRSVFKETMDESMCYETFAHCPSESGGGVLAIGGVLGKDDVNYMALSFMPRPLTSTEKRAAMSCGLVNDSVPEGRRFWDRYKEEDENEEKKEDKQDDSAEEKVGPRP
jgi:hypothetical protein